MAIAVRRYRLLLQDLLKRTPDTDKGRPAVEAALGDICAVADKINSRVAAAEETSAYRTEFFDRFHNNNKTGGLPHLDSYDPSRRLLKYSSKVYKVDSSLKGGYTTELFLLQDALVFTKPTRVFGHSLQYHVAPAVAQAMRPGIRRVLPLTKERRDSGTTRFSVLAAVAKGSKELESLKPGW